MSKLTATFNDLAALAGDLDALLSVAEDMGERERLRVLPIAAAYARLIGAVSDAVSLAQGGVQIRGDAAAWLLSPDAAKEIEQLKTRADGRKGG